MWGGWRVRQLDDYAAPPGGVRLPLSEVVQPRRQQVAVLLGDNLANLGHETGRYLLTASTSVQEALDSYDNKNGVFVYAEGRADFIGLALGIVAAAIGILAWRLLLANRLWPAVAALLATMMCINTLAYAVLLPGAEKLWLSERLADAAAEVKPCAAPTTLVVDYIEPSVVYRLGTDVQLTSAEKAADTFAAATCAVAFIKDDATPAFLAAFNVAAPGMAVPVPVKAVTARNINGFRLRTMQVFAKGG